MPAVAVLFCVVAVLANVATSTPSRVSAAVFQVNSSNLCPSITGINVARESLSNEVFDTLLSYAGWEEVVNLDMTVPSQSCPAPWTEVSSPGRYCVSSSCSSSVIFQVPKTPFLQVLGRVRAFGTGGLDAFFRRDTRDINSIDRNYVDGVSITYGSSPRGHIWSFASGWQRDGTEFRHCPCDASINTTAVPAPWPPAFVGNNFFCDGPYNGFLWDGQECVSSCCDFNNPPWFTVTLPSPTSDNIEVRVCTDESPSDERIYIQRIQLLVK